MRIMVSEQIIEEEHSCSSAGGHPNPGYLDEKLKPILISSESYNNIHEVDNSTPSPRGL